MWDLRGRLGYMGFEVKGAVLGERESITANYEFRRFMGPFGRTVLSVHSRIARQISWVASGPSGQ